MPNFTARMVSLVIGAALLNVTSLVAQEKAPETQKPAPQIAFMEGEKYLEWQEREKLKTTCEKLITANEAASKKINSLLEEWEKKDKTSAALGRRFAGEKADLAAAWRDICQDILKRPEHEPLEFDLKSFEGSLSDIATNDDELCGKWFGDLKGGKFRLDQKIVETVPALRLSSRGKNFFSRGKALVNMTNHKDKVAAFETLSLSNGRVLTLVTTFIKGDIKTDSLSAKVSLYLEQVPLPKSREEKPVLPRACHLTATFTGTETKPID